MPLKDIIRLFGFLEWLTYASVLKYRLLKTGLTILRGLYRVLFNIIKLNFKYVRFKSRGRGLCWKKIESLLICGEKVSYEVKRNLKNREYVEICLHIFELFFVD